ncbi:sodium-independent anion transporter [Oceanisphaera profunda]|uniref:Sodium-independent anion transporter n=1 Tax=Oceanisphaera profunda TaxID=1416627 RepID=A0A1Y0D1B3_9GAMM|nr:SulP family inorganic anion transporter [Oceanisphaera profunda]ART81312.1 sodium-independent anion transporter [Oceanisphaera profunda]
MLSQLKQTWFFNIRGDVLAGLVVALALIPEALAFAVIAGVDPKVSLYASFSMAVVIAFAGGRPGMISAATGAMALLIVTLVKDHGLQYLLAATLLCGVLQLLVGYFRLAQLMRFVSTSVVTGFVNALAILIFMVQVEELMGGNWHVYAMAAAGLAIVYLLPLVPYLGKVLPSPLVCIVILTLVAVYFGIEVPNVGSKGELPSSLPIFLWPDVPLNFETLAIIFPYSLSLAIVGLLESMMTATIVDDFTDTQSDKNRECKGQGIANLATGLLGGMAGCAVIGQSVINVKSGGRGRLSTLVAGVVLLLMVVFLGPWVSLIPMAALVAVMIMVSIGTFSWSSIVNIKSNPPSSSIVMIATVAVVVYSHNLAYGVLVGVLLSALFFAHKISRLLTVTSSQPIKNARNYQVVGQVFFTSKDQFVAAFDFKEVLQKVSIDVSRAHFWDISAIAALDKVVLSFKREGAEVEIIGLNEASATLVDRFGLHQDAKTTIKLTDQ